MSLAFFRRSLAGSRPGDSIVRKLYAVSAQCHNHQGQGQDALRLCREGRALFPEDLELAFQEGVIRRGMEDKAGAEACWREPCVAACSWPLLGACSSTSG